MSVHGTVGAQQRAGGHTGKNSKQIETRLGYTSFGDANMTVGDSVFNESLLADGMAIGSTRN